MSLTLSDKKEIETMVRKEIKDFLSATTLKQFEKNMIDSIKSELKKGTLRGDINDIIVHMMSEFYYLMWSKKKSMANNLKK